MLHKVTSPIEKVEELILSQYPNFNLGTDKSKKEIIAEFVDAADVQVVFDYMTQGQDKAEQPCTTMIYMVGIKHNNKGISSQVYWFRAKPEIAENLTKNDWVLCDTYYGPSTGIVVYPPVLLSRSCDIDTMYNALGCKGAVKEVLSKIDYSQHVDDMPF